MANKDKEYEVLRSEILEYWKIQENLSYASIIVVGAAFLGFDKVVEASQKAAAIPVMWLVLSILHVLVYVIATRLWMNYHRIFRIGAYIRIFHDQTAPSAHSMTEGAWHRIWREIDSDRPKYKIKYDIGSFAPKTDAVTLGAILVIGGTACFFADPEFLVGTTKHVFLGANALFGAYTGLRLSQLAQVNREARIYSEAFQRYANEHGTSPTMPTP